MATKRSKQAEIVYQAILAAVNTTEAELVDVRYVKEGKNMFLRIFIDKRNGVNMVDCEAVSRLIDPIIDKELGLSSHDYLEVQSCGLDWSLDNTSDRERHLGEDVVVVVGLPDGSKVEYTGVLTEVCDATLTLTIATEMIKIATDTVSSVKRCLKWD